MLEIWAGGPAVHRHDSHTTDGLRYTTTCRRRPALCVCACVCVVGAYVPILTGAVKIIRGAARFFSGNFVRARRE